MIKKWRLKIIITLLASILVFLGISFLFQDNSIYLDYKSFSQELDKNNIDKVFILEEKLEFYKNNDKIKYYTDNPEAENFKEKLLLKGIKVESDSTTETITFVFDIIFYLIFFGMAGFGIYKLSSMTGNSFKVVKNTNTKFEDIAGMDDLKKEMLKVVDILKNQKQYKEKGIRPIKGIILEGAPGNGKTLFAKALAGETDVNFIATKGADFQSAVMSMGARKIKTLFKKAKKSRPCIIFIDEFDGIGERRNYAGTGVDKENNRIITTMLNEMDGFDTQSGILVIAATNSYNSLDPALIRPGRFDLKYNIPNPDYNTRIKLIELYTKNKILSDDISNKKLADAFENLSCSAIEAILNEASTLASIENVEKITMQNVIVAASKTNCNINIRKLMK
ncbi:MAG: AAA family ATPase [Clostridia bacterium]|nr:AAA family ATPase [Clostridia bacterium]